MRMTITQTHGSAIAERLARRLDVPCRDEQRFADGRGTCILVGGLGDHAATGGEVRVLIHYGEAADLAGYDLIVNSARLGEDATVELLSQFVALKVMSQRNRNATGGRAL